jgi:hypothetical protein
VPVYDAYLWLIKEQEMPYRYLSVLVPFTVTGCINYGAPQLEAMSTLDLCETHIVQRVNLSGPTREAVQSELDRRKVDCRSQLAAIKARHDEDLYDRTYRNQSP